MMIMSKRIQPKRKSFLRANKIEKFNSKKLTKINKQKSMKNISLIMK